MTRQKPVLLFYVQHLLGVGHVKRASVIARRAAAEGWSCHVVLGGPDAGSIDWGNATCHRLPAIRSLDESFSTYVADDGTEPDAAYWHRRKVRVCALAEEIAADVLLIEQYPFGRRKFRHEIAAMIDSARARQPDVRICCSVRDILVKGKSDDKNRWTVDTLRRDFDRVLVHGDPSFVPFGETFPFADEIGDVLAYTGYVAEPRDEVKPPPGGRKDGPVVVSAGGGAVGGNLLTSAMDARLGGLLAEREWLFLTGPNLDGRIAERLRAEAPAGVSVEPNRTDYTDLLARAFVSLSQAGYNTVMDIIRTRCPAVVVPLAADGENEQSRRAEVLQQRGFLVSVAESALVPARLSDAVTRACDLDIPHDPPFAMNGAAETLRILGRLT